MLFRSYCSFSLQDRANGAGRPYRIANRKDNRRLRSLGGVDTLDGAMNCGGVQRRVRFTNGTEAEFGGNGEDHLSQPEGGLGRFGLGMELREESVVGDIWF